MKTIDFRTYKDVTVIGDGLKANYAVKVSEGLYFITKHKPNFVHRFFIALVFGIKFFKLSDEYKKKCERNIGSIAVGDGVEVGTDPSYNDLKWFP